MKRYFTSTSRFALWAIAALIVTNLSVSTSLAASRTWDAVALGDWTTDVNWSQDTEPTSADTAILSNTGTAQLLTGASGTYNSLYVGIAQSPGGGSIAISGGNLVGVSTTYLSAHQGGGEGHVTVTNAGTWNASILRVGNWGSNASLSIASGGSVSSDGGVIGLGNKSVTPSSDYFSTGNSVTVSGTDSTWTSGQVGVGSYGSGNTLLIEDGGLVQVTSAAAYSVFVSYEVESFNNYIRLDGGYLAWSGDQTANIASFVNDGQIQLWNGAGWETIAAANYAYFASAAEAEAVTGRSGLGGYTVVSSQAVPEPGTSVLLFLGAGILASRRCRL